MKREEAIKSIIISIKDTENGNRIVPVLGSDCFYALNDQDQKVTIQQYIIELLFPNIIDEESFSKCLMGFKGLSYLKRVMRIDTASLRNSLYRYIIEDKSFFSKICLKKEIRDFLERGQFPLVIVTTTIPILRIAPFPNLRVNGEPYKAIYYKKENKTSQDIIINEETERLATPIIFQIFGSFVTDDQCVLSENDFLDYLHCLHDTVKRPNKLFNYLKDKYPLMLGCDIPDWTFRFMLHSLKGNFDENRISGLENKEKFIGGTANDYVDNNLKDFLEDISYYSDSDIEQFIKDINQGLDIRPGMFISYSSHPNKPEEKRDYRDVKIIQTKLSSIYKTWFYEDEPGTERYGCEYWDKIQKGLKSCEYIIYIITRNVIRDLRESSVDVFDPVKRDGEGKIIEDNGFITEWKLSLEIMKNRDSKGKVLKKQFTILLGVSLEEFQNCYQNCRNKDGNPVFDSLFAGKQHCTELPEDFRPDMLNVTD